ncbi:MAG: hotdog fold thioesterase [Crocinitomicaceae bacterium]|nr:hotdog fold thioesterase [Crocinitomicaceae bacterium]
MTRALKIVTKMLANDEFSKWLKINLIEVKPGYCKLSIVVNKLMLNGFNIAHGGICFSISDSALAFAANANGVKCYTIETNLTYHKKILLKDLLTVEAKELDRTEKKAHYEVTVYNIESEVVSVMKGVVHVSKKEWQH